MEQNNRSNRYRNYDDRTSNSRRDNQYDRDRNYNDWDRNYNNRTSNYNDRDNDYRGYNNGNRNVYSSDRERDYWNGRNEQMNDWNNNYRNSNYKENDRGSGNMNNDTNYNGYRYGNDYYNDRYRNEGWRDNYRNEGRGNRNTEDRDWWDRTKDEVSSWFGDDEARRRRRMDEFREGEHRGKGPKNYSRSIERIKEDASDRLSDDSLIDASNIEIEVKDNELTLYGTVNSRFEKRRAEDLVEDVSGVSNVQNNLRVKSIESTGTGSNMSSMNSGTAMDTGTGTSNQKSNSGEITSGSAYKSKKEQTATHS